MVLTYRGAISTRATLLASRSRGSSSADLTSATSRSSLTTVSLGSFLASGSGRSRRSRVALWSWVGKKILDSNDHRHDEIPVIFESNEA